MADILFIPFLVHEVVGGVGMGLGSDGFGTVFDLFGRDAGPYSRLEGLVCRNDGSGGDDGSVRHDGVVHDDGPHSDDHVVADDTAMDIGTMADRYVVADDAFRLFIRRMEDRIVLDVDAVADVDGTDVAAKHRTVPYAAVVTDLDCSDYCRRLRQKRALPYDGHIAPEFLDYCHKTNVYNFAVYICLLDAFFVCL